MSPKPLPIAETLIATATRIRAISNHYVFRPMGMTSSSFRILRLLSEQGSMNPSGILEWVGNTKSNLSQRLDILEKKGLLKRKSGNNGDRRNVTVSLTIEGRELVKKVQKKFLKACTALQGKFSKAELDGYFAFIDKINDLFDEHKVEIPKLFKE